ncbi:hypothetical protein [Nakamurella sp.]|uniref:hypothetical protein n=1 Tax=Nakamurella sp. TaxID=1869182 RepID=UPI00378315DC
MSLSAALATIAGSSVRLREMLWRIVQTVPVDMTDPGTSNRYPSEIVKYFPGCNLADLDRLRRRYRKRAGAFINAVRAVRQGELPMARELILWMDRPRSDRSTSDSRILGFAAGVELILGAADTEYIRRMLPPQARRSPKPRELDRALARLGRQIGELEFDTAVDVEQFIEALTDIAAFDKFTRGLFGSAAGAGQLVVYPGCTAITQDSPTMATCVTTTSLVRGPFAAIVDAIDPVNWARSSNIITVGRYVPGPFTLEPIAVPPGLGDRADRKVRALGRARFFEEKVRASWNGSGDQTASYHNVLNIRTSKRSSRRRADVSYNLCRSIDSTILWDRRAGGLLLDEGYLQVRPLAGRQAWRLTMRKKIAFGDRFGAGSRPLPGDLLQMVEYLAPAYIALYVECAMNGVAETHLTGFG